ncbi:hypothetical protein PAXRUDRAFT_83003, partial [Paxillus rubicundulus Ve08.2h10]
QDNDLKHTSNLATDWFSKKKIDELSWAPNSPDMNIIEHAWDYLGHHVHIHTVLLSNLDELWEPLVEEWGQIDVDYIVKLYKSVPHWVEAFLEAK